MSENELPQYDEKADVWSLGCLVFEALTGQQPFMAESPTELEALQGSLTAGPPAPDGAPLLLHHPAVSKLAREFLAAVLCADPARRASAAELLQHPWVQRYAAGAGAPHASPWTAPAGGSGAQPPSHQHHQHHHSSPGSGPAAASPQPQPQQGRASQGRGVGAPLASNVTTVASVLTLHESSSDASVHDSSDSGEGLAAVALAAAAAAAAQQLPVGAAKPVGRGVPAAAAVAPRRTSRSSGGTVTGWPADAKARVPARLATVGVAQPAQ